MGGVKGPKEIFAVWVDEVEVENIKAIWEKEGKLGTVVDKIRASEATKGTKSPAE